MMRILLSVVFVVIYLFIGKIFICLFLSDFNWGAFKEEFSDWGDDNIFEQYLTFIWPVTLIVLGIEYIKEKY